MNERSITITEIGGDYRLGKSDFGKFELLGLLEQIIFDLKNAAAVLPAAAEKAVQPEALMTAEENAREMPLESTVTAATVTTAEASAISGESGETETLPPQSENALSISSNATGELRTRIGNAVKAISELGGATETADYAQMSEAELQAELEALTDQYKRLKASKAKK